MYLACCGAGGTGKSTIAQIMEEKHDFVRIPSQVEYLRKFFYGRNAKYTDKFTKFDYLYQFQKLILASQIAMERNIMLSNNFNSGNLIVDRSVYDYAAYFIENAQNYADKDSFFINDYVERISAYASTKYDGVIYFQPGLFMPEQNEFKERDSNSILSTDTIMKTLLKKSSLPLLVINTNDLELREKAILDFNEQLSCFQLSDYDIVYADKENHMKEVGFTL